MIRYLLIFAVVFLFSCKSSYNPLQRTAKGVTILEKKYMDTYKNPTSIVFQFNGDTHLINNFLDLKEKLDNEFKNEGIKTGYIYNLKSENSLQSDLDNIPKSKVNINDFDVICSISLPMKDMKNIGNRYIYNYNINTTSVNSNKLIASFNLLVDASNNITTKNKDISHKIFNLITKKDNF